jgi:hypothetical protein
MGCRSTALRRSAGGRDSSIQLPVPQAAEIKSVIS